jgi:hypothetical protein
MPATNAIFRVRLPICTALAVASMSGCSSPPTRRDTSGERADYARLQDVVHRSQQPSGRVDPAVLLDPDLYGGPQRRTGPAFDVPAPTPPTKP